MASKFSDKHFHDEASAYAWVEARIWPEGPVCPHCGGTERIGRLKGKSTRIGVLKCYDCRRPFSVKVKTVFESSHIPLRVWLQAMFLLSSSKKGISSNQLHRALGVSLKSAWFMSHRIREAMRDVGMAPLGSGGGVVEADETYIGRRPRSRKVTGTSHKMALMSLVERGGSVRSVMVERVTKIQVSKIINENVAREAKLITDSAPYYQRSALDVSSHDTVNHAGYEYVRGDIHTNTVEGFYSIFKRGMKGVYQHCKEKHLHRYAAEFDFRYSNRVAVGVNDEMRAERALKGIVGKRLTYRATGNSEAVWQKP
jgi:transposase-like protein